MDPVAGVEVRPVDAGKGDGSGFVVCLVLESGQKPHRAALDPARQYYQRIGDSFVILPHPLLRHMFYPQLRSKLETEIQVFTNDPVGHGLRLEGKLCNRGGASAITPTTRITVNQPLTRVTARDYWNATWNGKAPPGYIFKAKTDSTLHPGDDQAFFQAQWDAPGDRLEFRISLYSLNQEPHEMLVVIEKEELRHLLVKKSTPVVS